MKLILLILLSCSMATCSIAQNEKEVLKQPISYIQKVPAFARRLMPSQGKSLFWGKFSINPNLKRDTHAIREQQLQGNYEMTPQVTPKGFHLYSLYAPELKRKAPTSNYVQCHFALDIFTLRPKPKLINRVFLVFKGGWDPTTYGMSFIWIDQKPTSTYSEKNTIPMLVVRSFSNGIYGPLGIESFIAFPDGWTNQASVSNLRFGGWRGSYTAGEDNKLTIGWNGLIEIHASLSPTTNELTSEQYTRGYTFSLLWDRLSGKYAPHAEDQKVIETYFDPFQ